MIKLAFVILNFNSSKETLRLIEEIESQSWGSEVGIFVVDNNSCENEREILGAEFAKSINPKLKHIFLRQNYGYAVGNNKGIELAKSDGYNTIVISNPDIIFSSQAEFIKEIEKTIHIDNKITVIAPSIKNNNNMDENPFRKTRFTKKEVIKIKFFYLTGIYKIYYFIRVYILFRIGSYLANLKNEKIEKSRVESEAGYIYAPHGSFMILTQTFLKNLQGFDPNTFLYCEEFILAEKIREQNLNVYYNPKIIVIHKQGCSSDTLVGNYLEKVKFTLKHTFDSCRYFAKVINLLSRK